MVSEIVEALEWLEAAFAGWRFVFSPRYREKVFAGWKGAAWHSVAWDLLCGVAGMGFSIVLLALALYFVVTLIRP